MKFNETTASQIIELLQERMHVSHACDAVGITRTTFYHWMARGDAGEEPYADFARRVKTAKAQVIRTSLKVIRAAALLGDWKAEAWFLERYAPEEYHPQHMAIPTEKLTDVELFKKVEDRYWRMLEAMKKHGIQIEVREPKPN